MGQTLHRVKTRLRRTYKDDSVSADKEHLDIPLGHLCTTRDGGVVKDDQNFGLH